jgi:hypothetical protein
MDFLDFEQDFSSRELDLGFSLMYQDSRHEKSPEEISEDSTMYVDFMDGFHVISLDDL